MAERPSGANRPLVLRLTILGGEGDKSRVPVTKAGADVCAPERLPTNLNINQITLHENVFKARGVQEHLIETLLLSPF